MVHGDHVKLLKKALNRPNGAWADIGSGEGAFTLALADLLRSTGTIYSVDKNEQSLSAQEKAFKEKFPQANVRYLPKDYRERLYLPRLDGMIMANSLHFVENKVEVLAHLLRYLKPNGKFVLIEYNVDHGNTWVPYPISLKSFTVLARAVGLSQPELIGAVPSEFLKEIYSALAINQSLY